MSPAILKTSAVLSYHRAGPRVAAWLQREGPLVAASYHGSAGGSPPRADCTARLTASSAVEASTTGL